MRRDAGQPSERRLQRLAGVRVERCERARCISEARAERRRTRGDRRCDPTERSDRAPEFLLVRAAGRGPRARRASRRATDPARRRSHRAAERAPGSSVATRRSPRALGRHRGCARAAPTAHRRTGRTSRCARSGSRHARGRARPVTPATARRRRCPRTSASGVAPSAHRGEPFRQTRRVSASAARRCRPARRSRPCITGMACAPWPRRPAWDRDHAPAHT